MERAGSRGRVAALLLLAGLAAPAGEHLYWALGGTWGLDRSVDGAIEESTTTGIRVVAAVVVVLLVAAALVVLARAGLWRQPLVPDSVVRALAWGLAGFFLFHALVSFVEGWAGSLDEWWLYGPGGLVIGLLALVVAGSGERGTCVGRAGSTAVVRDGRLDAGSVCGSAGARSTGISTATRCGARTRRRSSRAGRGARTSSARRVAAPALRSAA